MKSIVLFTVILFGYIYSNAQDKIYFTNGDQVEAKILEVNIKDVKYKKYSNTEGPTYSKEKSKIDKIIYQNGESENFKENIKNEVYVDKPSSKEDEFRRNRIHIQIASISGDGVVFIPNIAYERINSKSKWSQEYSIDYRALTTTSYIISVFRLGVANNYYTKGNGKGFYVGPSPAIAFIGYSDYYLGDFNFMALDIGGQIGGQFQLTKLFGLNIRGKLAYLLPFESGVAGVFYYDILAGINFSF